MFIVTSQAAVTTEPTEGSLHDPTMRQDFEPFDIIGTFDDLQHPAELFVNLLHDRSVSAIRPDQFQAAVAVVQTIVLLFKNSFKREDFSSY